MRFRFCVASRIGLVVGGLGLSVSTLSAQAKPVAGPARLSHLADSVSKFLVFAPSVDTVFIAATRAKQLFVDIGRADINAKATPRRFTAYRQAVTALTPFPLGMPLRLVSSWGTDTVAISGFSYWNGRIVAMIHGRPMLDTLAREGRLPVAVAFRVDTTPGVATPGVSTEGGVDSSSHPRADTAANLIRAVVRDSCRRDTVPADLAVRAAFVSDSLDQWLRGRELPSYVRLLHTLRTVTTQVMGCFGAGRRLALAVDLRAGSNEWIRERMVFLDSLGRVIPLRVDDYRFRGHDLLVAFNANGDGIDDLAVRGYAPFAGGLAVMLLGPGNHLQRLASGFAWESQ